MSYEIRAALPPFARAVDLLVISRTPGAAGSGRDVIAFGRSVVMEEVAEPDCCPASPTLRLDWQASQQLMDELWQCGLRPSEGTGSAGSLAATERHLRDMQSIAMGLLKKDGVPV